MSTLDFSFDQALGRLGLSSSKRDAIAIGGITNAELFYMLDRQTTENLLNLKSMSTANDEAKYNLLAFQDWLHEQGNCVSLDAFTEEVMTNHASKMKARDATIETEFDKALSKVGLSADQRDAVCAQGIPDAATFALLDNRAIDDLLTDPALVSVNAFTKYKLRALSLWMNENPEARLESYTPRRETHEMTNIQRLDMGLEALPFAAIAAPVPAFMKKDEKKERKLKEREEEEKKEEEEKMEREGKKKKTRKPRITAPQTGPLTAGDSDNTDGLRLAKVTRRAILKGHTSSVRGILYYEREGKGYVASCSYDKNVKIWDIETRREMTTLKGHTGCVNALVHYKIGGTSFLATGANDQCIILWDLDNRRTKRLTGHTSDVRALAVVNMPNGEGYLASGSADNSIIIWDLRTMTPKTTLNAHISYVYALTAFTCGRTPILASGGNDNKIILWDMNKMEIFTSFTAHPRYVWSLINFQIDGKYYIASGSADKTIKLWQLGSKHNPVQTFEGHTGVVNALRFFMQDGVPLLVSGDSNGLLQFRDLNENRLLTSVEYHPSAITGLTTFVNEKSYLAIGHYSEIELWSE
eukprot:CAMPEP_0172490250 /NCGR_PEP_ID=MMETSP1066-20121228/20591_1 /TAXON_ID=671091 /ORGANISM="Coscinodiscus wailesii, Strain CCMP2513" /LENGTH=582 /DNA_ID=CAMNT_0013258615 /DNA_START=117 /DNA_END=1865 /DNA_ORIENTATION=+